MVVVLLATLLTLLASGGATGSAAEHCARLRLQSQARERLVTGHGTRVEVVGDSYSVGLGLRDPERSWPSRLPGRVHVFGFSGSGFSVHASACRHAEYAARAARALGPAGDLVVVEGGLNDFDQPERDVRAGFRRLLLELRGEQVLVVGPPEAPARAAAARQIDAILAEESARGGVRYLSMIGQRFGYLDDRLHLTSAGHRQFGDVVASALRP